MPLDLDDRVIEDARFGGPALDVLITAVWPEAYRIALTVLRDPGLAEDAAQEACASIARSLPNLKNSSGFRGWSYKTIVRCAITLARRRPRTEAIDDAINRQSTLITLMQWICTMRLPRFRLCSAAQLSCITMPA